MISIEQRTFNAAYIGLSGQGWIQSTNAAGTCLYRYVTPEGKKLACAAGQLFTDADYDVDMECTRAREGLVAAAIRKNGFCPHMASMIQKCHDGEGWLDEDKLNYTPYTAMSPAELQAAFGRFAVNHGLTIPEVPA